MFYTYILRSKSTGKRYIGHTADIAQRFRAHNDGMSKYTKGRGPWQLIHKEAFSSRPEAMKREKFLKSGQGREFLESLGK